MKTGYSFGSLASFVETLDKTTVKLTGDQTVEGLKSFSQNPTTSAAQGQGGSYLTRKDYVDTALAAKAPLSKPSFTGDVTTDARFIGAFTTSTWSSNVNTITPADKSFTYHTNIPTGTSNIFPTTSNANGILTFHTMTGENYHQLGFSSNGILYHRGDRVSSWGKVYTESQEPTASDVGALSTNGGVVNGMLTMTGSGINNFKITSAPAVSGAVALS